LRESDPFRVFWSLLSLFRIELKSKRSLEYVFELPTYYRKASLNAFNVPPMRGEKTRDHLGKIRNADYAIRIFLKLPHRVFGENYFFYTCTGIIYNAIFLHRGRISLPHCKYLIRFCSARETPARCVNIIIAFCVSTYNILIFGIPFCSETGRSLRCEAGRKINGVDFK
jgi:hypothetical protein